MPERKVKDVSGVKHMSEVIDTTKRKKAKNEYANSYDNKNEAAKRAAEGDVTGVQCLHEVID